MNWTKTRVDKGEFPLNKNLKHIIQKFNTQLFAAWQTERKISLLGGIEFRAIIPKRKNNCIV